MQTMLMWSILAQYCDGEVACFASSEDNPLRCEAPPLRWACGFLAQKSFGLWRKATMKLMHLDRQLPAIDNVIQKPTY
jgi:hypothetical protein